MDKAIQDNTVFSGSERAPIKWIELPDDLAKWADQNHELVERVQRALSNTYDTLSDEQLWEVIASACSAEWRTARTDLRAVETQWADLNSPEKTSLGLIGNALDSDENNAVSDRFAFSLAHFTIINEGLRQREDLSKLLSVLLVQKRMLERSAERTLSLQKATAGFAALAFEEAAARKAKPKKPGIGNIFRLQAEKLFKPKKATPPASLAPAPLSPER